MKPIILWHGARAWQGAPTVRPAKKGRLEGGPGIYMTTSLATARKYAKGGGVVMRFELDPNVQWLERCALIVTEAQGFVSRLRGQRAKKERVIDDLGRAGQRLASTGRVAEGDVPAAYLVNLLVNGDLLTGANGPMVAQFLVSHGIHASLASSSSAEDVVLLFDTSKIVSYKRIAPKDYYAAWDQPRVSSTHGGWV